MTTVQIAEVTYILIRIVSTFLKMKGMLTETVLTPGKSTMKHITYYLNHKTKENPHLFPKPVNNNGRISLTLLFVRIKNYYHCSFPGTLFPTKATIPCPSRQFYT